MREFDSLESLLVDLGTGKFKFDKRAYDIEEGIYRFREFTWRGKLRAVLHMEHPSGMEIVAFGELEEERK